MGLGGSGVCVTVFVSVTVDSEVVVLVSVMVTGGEVEAS